ncbi:Uncharacterised protein [Vibrio cholerae]|nr:Uncharacterised protein [Vibrio cholerae]
MIPLQHKMCMPISRLSIQKQQIWPKSMGSTSMIGILPLKVFHRMLKG